MIPGILILIIACVVVIWALTGECEPMQWRGYE